LPLASEFGLLELRDCDELLGDCDDGLLDSRELLCELLLEADAGGFDDELLDELDGVDG